MTFDFANAPRSFSRRTYPVIERIDNGAFWAHAGIIAGTLSLPAVPAHRLGLDWARCFHSLGVALGRHELRRLELQVAQQAWMQSPIARRQAP